MSDFSLMRQELLKVFLLIEADMTGESYLHYLLLYIIIVKIIIIFLH